MNVNEKQYKELSKLFLKYFNESWSATLDDLFFTQIQLEHGNRLRPFIIFGGYLYGKNTLNISETEYRYISNISVCVELIHKASLVLDDLIDQDQSRHGKPTFYTEYGENNAIMFAVQLIGYSIKKMNEISNELEYKHQLRVKGLPAFLDLICDMSYGELLELNLTENLKYDKDTISKIIKLQTSKIIQTSALLGYYATNSFDFDAENLFTQMGDKCGYIFQIMNDMEAFCAKEKLIKHKGNFNNDFEKDRKNIVIPYMFEIISKTEKQIILNASSNEQGKLLKKYFDKYDFKTTFINEIETIEKSIMDDIAQLTELNNSFEWQKIFVFFIESVTQVCKERLDI